MIEEVNGASATLSKTNRADEPVSGIPILHPHNINKRTHAIHRSHRSSASSTRTCLNSRLSTRARQNCRPRLPPLRRLASRSHPAWAMDTTAPVWVGEMPPTTSTAPTWADGRGEGGWMCNDLIKDIRWSRAICLVRNSRVMPCTLALRV